VGATLAVAHDAGIDTIAGASMMFIVLYCLTGMSLRAYAIRPDGIAYR